MTGGETEYYRDLLLERKARAERARPADFTELRSLLDQVDAALQRIDDGTYGLCETCHDDIEPERLRADPLLTLCLPHITASERRALEEDLALAARIQTALLPVRSLSVDGWEAAYHYQPAGVVSGDVCDLLRQGEGGLFFVAGDVSGKGVAASILMSNLLAIIRTLLSMNTPLAQLMERANRLFCEGTLPSSYATLVCGRVSAGGMVQLTNGGHCPPLRIGRGGAEWLPATALPLGLFCSTRYEPSSLQLNEGESLLLYSDGVTEARNAAGEEYGPERLAATAAKLPGRTAREVVEAVLADLRGFRGPGPNADDVTVLSLAWRCQDMGDGIVQRR